MPPDPDLTTQALHAFSRSFGAVPEAAIEQPEQVTLEDVRTFLIDRITDLIDANPALLMSILYRVDVAERAVQGVFAEAAPETIPVHLADLLIERQLQKLEIRRRYAARR